MEYNKLQTPFAKKMDKSCPHSYYPRPMMKRNSFLSLNGEWDFSISKETSTEKYNQKILVPFPIESSLSGIEKLLKKDEYAHYKRSFTIPNDFKNKKVLLHFGAVDTVCSVYINGRYVGKNEGGYIPFFFDITEYISDNVNTLCVDVKDGIDTDYPYGKQTYKRGGMWYTPVSGIWQSVWLESVPENHIEKIKITPSISNVKIEVFGGEKLKKITLKDTGEMFEFEGASITLSPKTVVNWSPENPYLYYFTLESGNDKIESYFALRKIAIEKIDGKNRITLNGKPYVFNGLLDQGYYPDGIFLPASEDGYLYDIRLAKSLGFNMLRKHIKIEPMLFYYLCDKEGIAVFQDMVNNSDYSFFRDTALPTIGLQKLNDKNMHRKNSSREIFTQCMLDTAELLFNTPSVLYYTIFNEGWGQFNSDAMYRLLKNTDSTRIVDSTSGWFRQSLSDVDSRHVYFKPLNIKRRNGKPLVISEFGGYSHRVAGHLFGKKNYGYKLFNSREDFEQAFLSLYKNEVRPLVDDGASAFVYTQLSDVEDETNGLVSYDRMVIKVDAEKTKALMNSIFKNQR